jgi:hypothetical protein
MTTVKELLRTGRREELWQMCCGFLNLNVEQFMSIQKRLLLEQIELLNQSNLGKKIMRGLVPQNVDEFRNRVPLTTYKDYCPELSERQENQLPAKPLYWQHSSGRSNEYPFKWENTKWVPMTQEFARESGKIGAATAILASCKKKGDVSAMKEGLKYIYAVAPRPYTSGTYAYIASEEIGGISLPSLEVAQQLEFEERLATSFKLALSEGFDFYFGLTLALVAIGERMNQQMGKVNIASLASNPKALPRLASALLKSKLAGRKLLPRDLWKIRGIMGSGNDVEIFRDVIKRTWGRNPLDVYASTEAGLVATQAWDFGSMTFVPSLNFLEFIPEADVNRNKMDRSYVPRALLLDEVKPGEKYELVITNFHGCPLVRYRTGDVIKITSMRNESLNIELPQMVFEGRVDYTIDIGGFIRLTEKVIWQAVSKAGVPYVDWVARKEYRGTDAILHVFLELKGDTKSSEGAIAQNIYQELKKMDEGLPYGNVQNVLNSEPIEVTLLSKGAFERYFNLRKSLGADLAHLKPPHINPTDKDLAILTPEAVEAPAPVSIPVGVASGK